MPTITEEQIDFGIGAPCISSARKFIIPVPRLPGKEGEPLIYPDGENAGKMIVDWKGDKIGDRGIVFLNGKDNSWQAAPGDGSSSIILNLVNEQQAETLDNYIHTTLGHKRGEEFSFHELKTILEYARTKLGVQDMYDSPKSFITKQMSRIGPDTGIPLYGPHKRDDRDICHAIYIPSTGRFKGPSATAQEFTGGAVIITQPGAPSRLVQPDIFQGTYKYPDGRKIDLNDLAMFYKADPGSDAKNPIDIIAGLIKAYDKVTLRDILQDLPNTVKEAYRYKMPKYTSLDSPNIQEVKTTTVGTFTLCYGKDAARSREPLVIIAERENGKLGAIGGYVHLGRQNTSGEQPKQSAARKIRQEAVTNTGTSVITPEADRFELLSNGIDYRIPDLPVTYTGHALELHKQEMDAMRDYWQKLETDPGYRTAVTGINLGEISRIKILPLSKALELDRNNFTHPHEYDALSKLKQQVMTKASPGRG